MNINRTTKQVSREPFPGSEAVNNEGYNTWSESFGGVGICMGPLEVWESKLAGTIDDGPTGISIDANEVTRNLITGQLVMVTTAMAVGAISATTPQDIWDSVGTKHTIPTSDLIGLLLRYGATWSAMFAEFAP